MGTIKYSTGAYYKGEWKNGFLSGEGFYIDEGNNKYNGNFDNGLFNGTGTMEYSNGDKYEGEW